MKKIQIWWLCLTCTNASFAHLFGDLYHVIAQLQRARCRVSFPHQHGSTVSLETNLSFLSELKKARSISLFFFALTMKNTLDLLGFCLDIVDVVFYYRTNSLTGEVS